MEQLRPPANNSLPNAVAALRGEKRSSGGTRGLLGAAGRLLARHPKAFGLLKAGVVVLLASATLFYALVCLLPWQPSFPGHELDASWQAVFMEASAHHWQFGTDIAFTYGPWAFVAMARYHPSLYGITIFGPLAVLITLLVISLWKTACGVCKGPWQKLLLGIGLCCAIIELLLLEGAQERYLMLGYLLIWQAFLLHFFGGQRSCPAAGATRAVDELQRRRLRQTLGAFFEHAFIVAAALVSLFKFSHQTLAVCVMAAICADDLFYRRRFPWKGCTYLIAWLGFWLAARQSLGLLLPYLRNSFAVAVGYCEMKMSGPEIQIEWYLATAVIALLALGLEKRATRRWWALIPVLFTAAAFQLLAKVAFVRHDLAGHAPIAFLFMAGWWLMSGPLLWKQAQTKGSRRLLKLGAHFAGIAVLFFCPQLSYMVDHWQVKRLQLARSAKHVVQGKTDYQAAYERAQTAIRQQFPLPEMTGTVDLYPTDAAILLAHGVRYQPRPVLQSYSAYTPLLAAINAEHLRGSRAPDNVLFDIQPMWTHADYCRFPSLDDGLSWLELLTHYDVSARHLNWEKLPYLWLKRASRPRSYTLVPLEQRTVAFGEPVSIPSAAAGPIWAEIDVARSLLGQAATLALKDPFVDLEVVTCDHHPVNHGLVLGTARAGFLLSPVIANREWYAWLASTPWNDSQWQEALRDVTVEQIRIVTRSKDRWAFQPTVSVNLYRLKFEESPNGICRFPATDAAVSVARAPAETLR